MEIYFIWFLVFMIGGAAIGLIIPWKLFDLEEVLKPLLATLTIFFSIVAIGFYSMEYIWEAEIELEEKEWECERICEDQGLEYVDYIAGECLCRKHKFTLVNGEADKNG